MSAIEQIHLAGARASGNDAETEAILVSPRSGAKYVDEQGRNLWWFGTIPPEGIPNAARMLGLLRANQLLEICPPFAAVVYGVGKEACYACTDILGLKHLFLRDIENRRYVSPDALSLAALAPFHIDAIGAYELLVVGAPQQGRTLFKEVSCLPPATALRLWPTQAVQCYWRPPPPAPSKDARGDILLGNALAEAIAACPEDDWQELTAGKDTLLLLATQLALGRQPRTWTLGSPDDPDMLGAIERAAEFRVPHLPIITDPISDLSPSEVLDLLKRFLHASSGMANVVNYWLLPWVLDRLPASVSMSGVGGEVFRGFYDLWVGRNILPWTLGKRILLRGKVREQMPFRNPAVARAVSDAGDRTIKGDLWSALARYENHAYALKAYYVTHRLHSVLGANLSATGRWRAVRAPLCHPKVLQCFPLVAEYLDRPGDSLVVEVTQRFLRGREAMKKHSGAETQRGRILRMRLSRILQRAIELRGTLYRWDGRSRAQQVFASDLVQNVLKPASMRSAPLYHLASLQKLVQEVAAGSTPQLFLGGVLTIELAMIEAKSECKGLLV